MNEPLWHVAHVRQEPDGTWSMRCTCGKWYGQFASRAIALRIVDLHGKTHNAEFAERAGE